MRFIDKHRYRIPKDYEKWLLFHDKVLQEKYVDTSITGARLWAFMDVNNKIYDKEKLKVQLLEDQGYICCYCGQRIEHEYHTRIEHVLPKSKYKKLTYDYNNLLVACRGGCRPVIHIVQEGESIDDIAKIYNVDVEDLETIWINNHYKRDIDLENLKLGDRVIVVPQSKKDEQHCDVRKGNEIIAITPLQKKCNEKFTYLESGKIIINNENQETVKILGLNKNPKIIKDRKNIVTKIVFLRERLLDDAGFDKSLAQGRISKLIQKYNKGVNGKLDPYCFVTISKLQGN